MPRSRFSSYKSSLSNRGPQSGGSIGGNNKAGLVTMWQLSRVPYGQVVQRFPNACCRRVTMFSMGMGGSSSS